MLAWSPCIREILTSDTFRPIQEKEKKKVLKKIEHRNMHMCVCMYIYLDKKNALHFHIFKYFTTQKRNTSVQVLLLKRTRFFACEYDTTSVK